jgi:hypothetical protein
MSVRPVLLKDLRRTAIQHHQQQIGTGDYNRYSPLAEKSRTFSFGKRKLENSGDASSAPKTPRFDSSVVFKQLEGQDTVLGQVKEALDKFDGSQQSDNGCTKCKESLGYIGTALRLLLNSHENLTSVMVDAFKVNSSAEKPAPGNTTVQVKPSKAAEPEVKANPELAAAKKVKNAIREAEKKTVLFNLDLGNVPTMNKDTLSRKVTMALSSKVSAGKHDFDIKDAEEIMDDILSCAKLEFLGSTTKKYTNSKNPNDPKNNKMCTMPVRFEFKDKDTRFQAEKNLRKICNASCSVPYPKRLRILMNKLVTEGKKVMPDCFIRTRVNIDSLTIDVHAKTSDGWKDLAMKTSIPLDICDQVGNNLDSTQGTPLSQVESEVMTIS